MAQHEVQGHMMAHGGAGESYEPQFHFGTDASYQDFFAGHNGVLLNPQEQEQLNQFWDDPNGNTDNIFFNNLFMDTKSSASQGGDMAAGGYDSTSPTGQHPATTIAPTPESAFNAHSHLGSDHVTGANHVTDSSHNFTHLTGDTDVTAAASSLFGMSVNNNNNNQHNHINSSTPHHTKSNPHSGGTWPSMDYSQNSAQGDQGEDDSSPVAPSAGFIPSSSNHVAQQHQNHQQHQQQQQGHVMTDSPIWQQMHVPRLHHAGPSDHGREDSYQAQAQVPMQYLPHQASHGQWNNVPAHYFIPQNIKPSMQWGSDQNFGIQGFRGLPQSDMAAKHGNLLGVPMAHQAAAAGYPQMHSYAHGNQPMYNGHRLSLPSPSHGAAYSPPTRHDDYKMPTPPSAPRRTSLSDAFASNSHKHNGESAAPASAPARARTPARKRRRSGDEEDDDDYTPYVHTKVSAPKPKPSAKYSKARLIKQEAAEDEDDIERALQRSAKRRKSSGPAAKAHGYSPGSPASPGPADTPNSRDRSGEIKIRSNLSDVQKRSNHIKSEQRRRNTIKDGYADIDRLVPALKNGKSGLSKSDALFEAVKFIQRTVAGNNFFERKLNIVFEKVYHHVDNDDDDGGIGGFGGANDDEGEAGDA